MLVEEVFDTGVVAINYAEGPPSGAPMLLLHGLPGCWQDRGFPRRSAVGGLFRVTLSRAVIRSGAAGRFTDSMACIS